MKRYSISKHSIIVLFLLFCSCKKQDSSMQDCFSNYTTIRQIINKPAVVKLIGGQFYIIEQRTIDTKLKPCTLAKEFQVNNLNVIISGDVKASPQITSEPCCTDNFVITSIVQ